MSNPLKCGHRFNGITCDMQANHGGNSHAGPDANGNLKWQHMLALAGAGPESDGVPEPIGALETKTEPMSDAVTQKMFDDRLCPDCGTGGSLFDAKLELMHCMNATSDGCGKVWKL